MISNIWSEKISEGERLMDCGASVHEIEEYVKSCIVMMQDDAREKGDVVANFYISPKAVGLDERQARLAVGLCIDKMAGLMAEGN